MITGQLPDAAGAQPGMQHVPSFPGTGLRTHTTTAEPPSHLQEVIYSCAVLQQEVRGMEATLSIPPHAELLLGEAQQVVQGFIVYLTVGCPVMRHTRGSALAYSKPHQCYGGCGWVDKAAATSALTHLMVIAAAPLGRFWICSYKYMMARVTMPSSVSPAPMGMHQPEDRAEACVQEVLARSQHGYTSCMNACYLRSASHVLAPKRRQQWSCIGCTVLHLNRAEHTSANRAAPA